VFRKKKGGAPPSPALEVKVDSYVLETDVHFPTDLKSALGTRAASAWDLIVKYRDQFGLRPAWLAAKAKRSGGRQLKNCERTASQTHHRGRARTREKHASRRAVPRVSGRGGRPLHQKCGRGLLGLCEQPVRGPRHWEGVGILFNRMLDKASGTWWNDRLLKEGNLFPSSEEGVLALRAAHRVDQEKGQTTSGRRARATGFSSGTCQHQLIHDYDVASGRGWTSTRACR